MLPAGSLIAWSRLLKLDQAAASFGGSDPVVNEPSLSPSTARSGFLPASPVALLVQPTMFLKSLRHLVPRALFVGLFASSTGSAQPNPGRATFYTEPNFRGESLVVETDTVIENLEFVRDGKKRPFNDRFRSVRIEGPVRVVVFERARFGGASTWLNRDTADLSAYSRGQSEPGSWDRAISSVQVEPAPPGPTFTVWQKRDAERAVRAVYRDILSRDPDNSGLRFYLGRLVTAGWSEAQLRQALHASDEFKHRDLAAIVRRCYREALGRDPDGSGMASYTRALDRGQTEAELLAELRRSREGQDYHIGQVIARAYREILKREVDPAGMETYRRLVRDKAYDEGRIRDALRRSEEYKNLGKR